MAVVRSKRLFGPVVVGTGATPVYTCPAGETALLKTFTCAVGSLANSTINLFINGATVNQQIAALPVPNGQSRLDHDLFIVLHPGDVLRAGASSGTFTVAGFGAELEGVAD